MKKKALKEKFVSASAITERVIIATVSLDDSLEALPPLRNIARAANGLRRQTRPREPTTLEFTLDASNLPHDFLQVINSCYCNGRILRLYLNEVYTLL